MEYQIYPIHRKQYEEACRYLKEKCEEWKKESKSEKKEIIKKLSRRIDPFIYGFNRVGDFKL